MSPLLFALFVEDLELYLQNGNCGLDIDDIVVMLLLIADNMAIIGKTPTENTKPFRSFVYLLQLLGITC
jgi:hypothetical protein